MKPARFIGALAVAALATGGSAFTGSNTFVNDSQVAGYGEQSSTGALIVQVNYTPWATDRSLLSSVSFVTTTDLTGKTASLTLKNGSTLVASYACAAPTEYTSGLSTIVCDVTGHDPIGSFDRTGLTVL
jgi:hypothetical protein